MKITFLGTSHGVPAADRYCSCTMIEVNGAHYFIDAGAPLIDLLLRRHIDLDSVRTVFTTHFHSDHVDGLLSFAGLCSWYFKTTAPRIYVTEQKGMDAMKALLEAAIGNFDGERVRFEMMTPETVYEDENIRVTPFPTQHLASSGRPAYSYLVEAEGKKVFFSGDLSVHLEKKDFPAYVLNNEVDLMICEMAHFTVDEATPYLESCRASQVLFNHVFPLDKLAQIDALDGRFGYPIHTVNDNDEIEL